jgi:hypothetical protein
MKKVALTNPRLTSLNCQETTTMKRKSASPFDDALKGLGVSERKKSKKKTKVLNSNTVKGDF